MLTSILEKYGLNGDDLNIESFGNGLINHTWRVKSGTEEFILQRINHHVFKDPYAISNNIRLVGDYLHEHIPGYLFVTPVCTEDGLDIIQDGEDFYRLFPFVKNSVTYTIVESPELAYEAARQFAKFTHHLKDFDESLLEETIPDFHNLALRYNQYKTALTQGNRERLAKANDTIQQLEKYKGIVDEFKKINSSADFKKRVMHHDTKISNVLFNQDNKGICIIDLDTVMPGFFISDVGDMMRTYLAAESEEETDFEKIEVREPYFLAIVEGYLSEMKDDLSAVEKNYFIYAAKFMIYMQSIRFLADYVMNDIYYGSSYEGQNFNRAVNQLYLLKSLEKKEERLMQKIKF